MSQLKEILEKEKERNTLEQCAVIHLFREGTFYRAYGWSAWLCVPRSVGFAIMSGRKTCKSTEKRDKKPHRLILKPR